MKLQTLLCLLIILLLSRVCPAKTTLVVWDLLPGAGCDAQVAEFERRNPHIKISRGWMSGGSDLQKPLKVITGGQVPDVVCEGDFALGIQATLDSYRPLDQFIAEDRNKPNGIRVADYYA